MIGGLLNGNVAVMQTMVAEMYTKAEYEGRCIDSCGTSFLSLDSESVCYAAVHVVSWKHHRCRDGRLSC